MERPQPVIERVVDEVAGAATDAARVVTSSCKSGTQSRGSCVFGGGESTIDERSPVCTIKPRAAW